VKTARKIMSQAQTISKVLWTGPAPLDETVNPQNSHNGRWLMYNDKIAEYDRAYADLTNQLKIDYLSIFQNSL
jgi:hypothetical protein